MRLAFVEMEGFRGFRDPAKFEMPRGFAVLTGRNGAGKSTVFDAIDFVLTGTINKFDVVGAKGGGLASHIWWMGDQPAENYQVTLGFETAEGKLFQITRTRERGLVPKKEELATAFCTNEAAGSTWSETLMRTTLIRDETLSRLSLDLPEQARFEAVRAAIGALAGPDHSARTEALSRTAATEKSEQEGRLKDAQAELGRALGALTEARSIAERQPSVSQADAIIRRLVPDVGETIPDQERLRRLVAERKQIVAELSEAVGRANRLAALLADFDLDKAMSEQAALAKQIDAASQEMSRAQEGVATAQQLSDSETQADEFAARFSALLDHGEAIGLQEGHCPLCDAVRSDAQFAASITAARTRLSERGRQVKAAADRLSVARQQAQAATMKLSQLLAKGDDLAARIERVTAEGEAILAAYAHHGLTAAISDPSEAQRQILQKQDETNELEQALYILEASSAHDRVTSLESRIESLRQLVEEETAKLASAERAVEVTRQIKNAATTVANEVLTEQFDTVMPLLKELYRRLRPHTDWREIETDFGGKVRASLNFTVGEGKNPQFLFSSGQRRAAGLAFLLAIHLSRPWCRLESLWLDDPVQHVDDYRALNLVEVLSAIRRSGRQVIVAVQDQALADLLCRRLRSSEAQVGRRFELSTATNGSAFIERAIDIEPMPKEVLPYAEAS